VQHVDLRETVESVLASQGWELDDLAVVRAGNRRVVRVTVDGDGQNGHGPGLDEIAAASAAISRALDEVEPADAGPYVLEVTSRGVNRPLTRPAHWRRNHGRLVQITQTDGSTCLGRIAAAGETGVRLDIDGAPVELPFDSVAKAVVQIEFNRPDGEPPAEPTIPAP
jgi:ribosome maturation factor RimP